MINRFSLWDRSLTLEAVGLWARLLSKPDDWSIYCTQLASESGVSKDTIRRLMNQLIEVGYVHRIKCKDESGKYTKVEYHVFETKKSTEEIKKMFPECKNPSLDKSESGKTSTTDIDLKNDTDEKKDIAAIPSEGSSPLPSKKSKPPKDPKIEVAPEVWLTEKQESDLLERLQGDELKRKKCYDRLSSWKIGKGRTGGSDYLSIIKWVIGAVEEDTPPIPKKVEKEKEETFAFPEPTSHPVPKKERSKEEFLKFAKLTLDMFLERKAYDVDLASYFMKLNEEKGRLELHFKGNIDYAAWEDPSSDELIMHWHRKLKLY